MVLNPSGAISINAYFGRVRIIFSNFEKTLLNAAVQPKASVSLATGLQAAEKKKCKTMSWSRC